MFAEELPDGDEVPGKEVPEEIRYCGNRVCQRMTRCHKYYGLWLCVRRCWRKRRSLHAQQAYVTNKEAEHAKA